MNETKTVNRSFRVIRIVINIVLLLISVVVIAQNAHSVKIDFLWTQFDVSLALLIILTGSVGSIITLFFLLFKK